MNSLVEQELSTSNQLIKGGPRAVGAAAAVAVNFCRCGIDIRSRDTAGVADACRRTVVRGIKLSAQI